MHFICDVTSQDMLVEKVITFDNQIWWIKLFHEWKFKYSLDLVNFTSIYEHKKKWSNTIEDECCMI